MRAVTALAAVLLCATALAILPAARASQQPCLDALGSSCGPNPVPVCRSQEVSTAPILDAYGASVTVRLNSNCTVSVLVVCPTTDTAIPPALPPLGGSAAIVVPISHGDVQTNADCTAWANETNTPCPNGFWHAPVSATEGPVHVTADSCVPMCACYPMEAPSGATSASSLNLPPIFQPCPSMGGCCGIEPEGGCCTTTCGSPCPTASEDTDALPTLGPIDPSFDGVAVTTTGCAMHVDQENDGFLACPHNWYNSQSTTDAGPATATTQLCTPPCQCEPMGAATAIPPPCQYCAPVCAPHAVASTEVTVYGRSDCSVLVDAHDQVTCSKGGWWPSTIDRKVGAEEARATFCLPEIECACDPMLAPAAASVPIECIMAPCGPQCIVPCVPQVVPSDCELREDTPASGPSVGPITAMALRNALWGSDPTDCTLDEHVGGPCPPGTDVHTLSQRAGPVLASVTVCTPGLDCTCDPIVKLE